MVVIMRAAILGFVAGVAVLQTRAALPDHPGLMLLALLALLVWLALLISFSAGVVVFPLLCARLQRLRVIPVARVATKLLLCGALGYCWAAWLAQMALAPALAK